MKGFFAAFFFLIIAFTTASVLSSSEMPETGAGTSLALSGLAVPEEVGKVQERFAGKSPRTIIQIQDVHAHAAAQQNIAAILERLRTVFGIERVALEGAWASTSLPKSHALPTSREKQLLAESLLDDDRISGPVYAAIMSPEPITLVGIEEEASYEKNRALFLDHLEKTREILGKLRIYGASLEGSQRSIWGPELLAFGSAFGKFRETSDLGKFLPVLLKAAESRTVDISDLAQIILLRDITALEKSFEKARLEKEVKQVLKKYKNRPWTIEELIRGGKIPPGEIGLYPEIKKLTLLYKMRDEISLQALTDQIETLTGRILGKLVRAPEENALWEKSERFYLAKRILLLQSSPADMKACEDEKFPLDSELAGAGLSEALSLSLEFYEVAKKRDGIFFDRIMNDPSLAGNIAVVTGGFHTDGLSQRFRDAGISYITITPELGGAAMNEKLYVERMSEASFAKDPVLTPQRPGLDRVEEQTLSERNNDIKTADDQFVLADRVRAETRDYRKGAAAFRGEPVTPSGADRAAARIRRGVPSRGMVDVSELRKVEFAELPRPAQLQKVRKVLDLEPASSGRIRAVLVTDADTINRLFLLEKVPVLFKQLIQRGDFFVLPRGTSPVTGRLPEDLFLAARGVKFFMTADLQTLLTLSPEFRQFAKRHPQAVVVMKNGDPLSADFVTLPETPEAFVLYWLIAQDADLYRAAKKPEFLELLRSLVAEILSRELPEKSV